MQTALFLTDCSVDSALTLRRWLSEHRTEPLRLTVVHAYDLEPGCSLTKEKSRAMRQEIRERVQNWLAMVPQPATGALQTEMLLGAPELVINLHLRLRRYDYLLLDVDQESLADTFAACQHEVDTQLIRIHENVAERVLC